MPRTKLSAAAYLILVFASGILVGIVSHRLYMTTTASANVPVAPKSMQEFKKRYFADMRQKVHATDAQIAQVNRILDDTKHKFDELHAQEKPLRDKIQQDQLSQIRALLVDHQRAEFDRWHDERMKTQRSRNNP
jgi:Spy/CpxP family protein refolding chaperone